MKTWRMVWALLALAGPGAVSADDAAIAKLLKAKGARVTEAKGVVTAVAISDGTQVMDADFQQLGKLVHLRTLDLNNCLNDQRLALLSGLVELEYLQTNLAQVTDDGLKPMTQLKGLRNVKFFHPGKAFSGAGLVHLADLPHLERLTVAGSFAFNDDGMAAVARLTRLQEFRMWHAGPADETLAILAELKALESLQLDEARLSLAALQQLKRLPALKKLTLSGIDMPRADVDRLRTEWPQVKIEWTEPNETYKKRIRALFAGE
jgi:hypothetical protein